MVAAARALLSQLRHRRTHDRGRRSHGPVSIMSTACAVSAVSTARTVGTARAVCC